MKINFKKILEVHSKDNLFFTPNPFSDWKKAILLALVLLILFGVGHYFLYVYLIRPPFYLENEPLIRNINTEGLKEAVSIIESKKSTTIESALPAPVSEIDPEAEL